MGLRAALVGLGLARGFDTALGKPGVGICYENLLAYIPRLMSSQSVDLLLMPHSAPVPMTTLLFPSGAAEEYYEILKGLAPYYASLLGIPAVFVNKCRPWVSPIPFAPLFTQKSRFAGHSAIADSNGTVKAQLHDETGIIVEEVSMDPARKTRVSAACRGRWARKLPFAVSQFRLLEVMGGAWYRFSAERRRRAREVCELGQ